MARPSLSADGRRLAFSVAFDEDEKWDAAKAYANSGVFIADLVRGTYVFLASLPAK